MLQSTSTALDNKFLRIWLTRYLPDLGLISYPTRKLVEERLSVIISANSRQKTRQKLLENLTTDCSFAGIQAQRLVSESGQSLRLSEAKDLSLQIGQVYEALLELYVKDFVFTPVLDSLYTFDSVEGKLEASGRVLPGFNRLMQTLEPLLVRLQEIYATSQNRRAIGFLTTQLHLSRQRIMAHLDAYERIWLTPYLRLIEDFVCMPWPRICAASKTAAPECLEMAQKGLLENGAIAHRVYQRALRQFPNHISRQGRIQSSEVQHSSLRDLVMFQAYLWLCVLEDDLSAIQDELLPLCILVFPCAQVQWSFVTQGVRWLIEEIKTELSPQQQQIFSLTSAQVERLFLAANPDAASVESISNSLKLRFAL